MRTPMKRPREPAFSPVAISTRALHTHTKPRDAAMRTNPMITLTAREPRSGLTIFLRAFKLVLNLLMGEKSIYMMPKLHGAKLKGVFANS